MLGQEALQILADLLRAIGFCKILKQTYAGHAHSVNHCGQAWQIPAQFAIRGRHVENDTPDLGMSRHGFEKAFALFGGEGVWAG